MQPIHHLIQRGLARIRSSMKGKNADKLLLLPKVQDKTIYAILRLLKICATIAISFNQRILPLLCFRVIELTLTHGTSEAMPCSIALYGAILCRRGFGRAECEKYSELALILQDKLGYSDLSHITFLTFGTAFTLTKKLSTLIKPLKAGYY